MKREISVGMVLLLASAVMAVISVLPKYETYVDGDEFSLREFFTHFIYPPEEIGDSYVLEANLNLSSRGGNSSLNLYVVNQSKLTLLEQVCLLNETEHIVSLSGGPPTLVVNITETSASTLTYNYTIHSYSYPYVLLTIPAAFSGVAGAATALVSSLMFLIERTRARKQKN